MNISSHATVTLLLISAPSGSKLSVPLAGNNACLANVALGLPSD